MENGRHRVFNFKLCKLEPNEINEKIKEVFEKLKCAAKINIALGFILRNVDTDEYRYFYAHENNTFLKILIYCAQTKTCFHFKTELKRWI